MSDLRDYVAGPHDSGFAARAESTVLLHVSHSHLRARFPEIRLDLHVEFEGGAGTREYSF
jgi:tubulin-folding cofactor B